MYQVLSRAYDGPIPPAELAAARWGRGAFARLERAADATLIEARLRMAVAALGQIRRGLRGNARLDAAGGLRRLVRAVMEYRHAALLCATACAASSARAD